MYENRNYLPPQSRIYELMYDPDSNVLLGLHTVNTTSFGTETRCAVIPYWRTLPFNTKYYTALGIEFTSITSTGSIYSCLMSGYLNGITATVANHYRLPIGSNVQCSTSGSIKYSSPEVLTSKEEIEPLTIFRDVFSFGPMYLNCTSKTADALCP